MDRDLLYYLIEIIGTLAFASSGALVGIRRKLDVFGIVVLAVTTALGGGLMRDVILGITPPNMFVDSSYTVLSIIMAVALFVLFKIRADLLESRFMMRYEAVMNLMDSIGLGAFTVIGIETAYLAGYQSEFLLLFVGMLTGVGGGIVRDIMAGLIPSIFVRHVYAIASLIGGLICCEMMKSFDQGEAMIVGGIAVVIIRILATRFNWNLPRIS